MKLGIDLPCRTWLFIIYYIYYTEQQAAGAGGYGVDGVDYGAGSEIKYKRNPAPDGHRCGVCPTYFQKICAFEFNINATYIFDNHCIMDLYNCLNGTEFMPINYDQCLYFGNFAYVHGHKHEDKDYEEDHIIVKQSYKSPYFVSY